MNAELFVKILCFVLTHAKAQDANDFEEPPEGYYAFVESPSAIPPKVRQPPYVHVNVDCKNIYSRKAYVSVSNICGDLNKGQIPRNPMDQNVLGEPYPFELIRNQTLKFLSKTLPVLKADNTLTKVTQILPDETADTIYNNGIDKKYSRTKRQVPVYHDNNALHVTNSPKIVTTNKLVKRESRKFCEGNGIFCTIYRAIQGESQMPITAERREEAGSVRYEGPPTPCPAKVEYATPVFAKNYQGSWRYVVQIPYEGYFTQTVEVTRCLQSRCHYLDGGCLSSPRWVSLLVAEIFYSNSDSEEPLETTTTTTTPPSVQDFQSYQQYLQRRAGVATASDGQTSLEKQQQQQQQQQQQRQNQQPQQQKILHCDGYDEMGCFQVRLYYDWFLIPGSCKCWRPDYFAKYVRRKSGTEL